MINLSQSGKRTRQRGKNFSPSEEDILLRLLQPYKSLIDNKRSDALTCQMKKEAWEQLSHDFTLKTGMPRTWRTLKDKYKNMNTKIKTQGRGIGPLNQFDDFEPQPSSCVTVVYEGEKDSSSDYLQDNITDDIELPMTIKTESIDEGPNRQEVPEVFSMSPTSQPSPLPNSREAATNNSKQFMESEKKILVGLQQNFYFNENERADQKHRLELQNLNLRKQLLELQLEEIRQRMKLGKENTTIPPTDDIELPNSNKTASIDGVCRVFHDPIQQEVPGVFSMPPSSQPPPLPSPDTASTNNLMHLMESENNTLVRLKQIFYFNANERANQEHRQELENINRRNKLFELELEEIRQRLKRGQENTTIPPN